MEENLLNMPRHAAFAFCLLWAGASAADLTVLPYFQTSLYSGTAWRDRALVGGLYASLDWNLTHSLAISADYSSLGGRTNRLFGDWNLTARYEHRAPSGWRWQLGAHLSPATTVGAPSGSVATNAPAGFAPSLMGAPPGPGPGPVTRPGPIPVAGNPASPSGIATPSTVAFFTGLHRDAPAHWSLGVDTSVVLIPSGASIAGVFQGTGIAGFTLGDRLIHRAYFESSLTYLYATPGLVDGRTNLFSVGQSVRIDLGAFSMSAWGWTGERAYALTQSGFTFYNSSDLYRGGVGFSVGVTAAKVLRIEAGLGAEWLTESTTGNAASSLTPYVTVSLSF